MNEVEVLDVKPMFNLTWQRMLYPLLGMSYFVLPISSSLKSVSLTLLLLAVLLTPANRQTVLGLFHTKWMMAICFFLSVIVLACLWGPASMKDKWIEIEKYSKLLYLPILVVVFRQAFARHLALNACLAGICLVAVLSMIIYFQMASFMNLSADQVFRNHIVFGFMGAYGAYLAAYFSVKQRGIPRYGYALVSAGLAFQVLWINGGRMAYLLLFVLAFLWMWQYLSKRQIGTFGLLFCVLFGMIYQFSPMMHGRISSIVTEWRAYHHESKNTSIGYRIQFHKYAKEQFVSHPLLGNGTGSFGALVAEKKLFPDFVGLRDPHSQYWLIATEQGMMGLIALLCFFTWLFILTYQLPETGALAIGLMIIFVLSQLTDSMLFYSGPGCFFIMIMAIYLGEAHENAV